MRIKLAVLEKDQNYLSRIIAVFSTRYADKLEIYSFTDQSIAMSILETSRIDVLIANNVFEIDMDSIPKRCGFAYFVESSDIDTFREQRAICKFQKADLIYKQILALYSEKEENISGLKLKDDDTKILAFCAVGGGTGTSSMAAAAAIHFASRNMKVLYLNLEKFGSADVFFSGEGQFDMSDVIFALKSRKTNLFLKLESFVKQDERGVYFYSPAKIALDMQEFTTDDVIKMISELKLVGSYDYIILDMDFALDNDTRQILDQTCAVVWVGDGSEISNNKIQRAYAALSVLDQNKDYPLINRLCLIYNQFSNKSGKTVGEIGIRSIGGAPRYEHANTAQVLEQLSKMEIFEKLFN